MNANQIVGICFLLFGIFKITMATLAFSLSDKAQAKIQKYPLVKYVIPEDHTFAGTAFDVALVIYAVYSILHGVDLLFVHNSNFITFIMDSAVFKLCFYGILGSFLVILYSLVVFTNLPISKNKNNYSTYEISGIGSGLCFLAVIPFIPTVLRRFI